MYVSAAPDLILRSNSLSAKALGRQALAFETSLRQSENLSLRKRTVVIHIDSDVHVHNASVRIALSLPRAMYMAANHEIGEPMSVIAQPLPLFPIDDLIVVVESGVVSDQRFYAADFGHHIVAIRRDSIVGVVIPSHEYETRIEERDKVARVFTLVSMGKVADMDKGRPLLRSHVGVGNEALLAVADALMGAVAETDDFLVSEVEVGGVEVHGSPFVAASIEAQLKRSRKFKPNLHAGRS